MQQIRLLIAAFFIVLSVTLYGWGVNYKNVVVGVDKATTMQIIGVFVFPIGVFSGLRGGK